MGNLQNPSSKLGINKTPPARSQGRNEESCENSRGVVDVPIVVEPVVVPVPLAVIEVEVQNVAVAVRTAKDCMRRRLCHHLSSALKAVSYS